MLTVGSKSQVFKGTAKHTSGGLTKNDISRISKGKSEVTGNTLYRYVSKLKRQQGKQNPWIKAVQKAKKHLGFTHEFIAPRKKGGSKDQRELYVLSKEMYCKC
jgi:hypothetical protein